MLPAPEHPLEHAHETTRVRESIYRRLLVAADGLAMFAALTILLWDHQVGNLILLAIPALIVCCKGAGLYDHDDLVLRRSTLDEFPRLLQLATLATLIFWLSSPAFTVIDPSRGDIVLMWAVLIVAMPVSRVWARNLAARFAPPERCMVVGDADDLKRMRYATSDNPAVVWTGSVPIERVVNDLAALRRIAAEHDAERLIIAPPNTTGVHEAAVNLIRGAKATGLRVSVMPGPLEVVTSAVVFDHQPGVTLLGVKRFGLTRSSNTAKRAFDLVFAGLATIVLAIPMAIIAVLIRLDSQGPVLFRQERIGRDGRSFEILKFRTMIDGADALRDELAELNEAEGGLFKISDDPRVTRVGRILRKTSLDELPQLFNVLRGEMSIVGPRPLVTYEDARVTGLDRRRLALTPGMTGPWQVTGGERLPLPEMVKMDYLYVAGWSLWSDLKIILRTLSFVLRARGH
ncbi:exopolysaccharide biosynthesis polyprenyl glycosylphosphotransferase [Paraconexibacter sp.]|uniref:exopolysaccharide biosynthesis polyprenyl glycosylphosphotransferase n=1 Tax=Paraconexibacter sp. TaxID=2949640 RepID=UPI003561B89F